MFLDDKPMIGIIEFLKPLYCSASILGQSFSILVGGHSGRLIMPCLPSWREKEERPLDKSLKEPPVDCVIDRKDHFYWGRPISYPSGNSYVYRAVVEFDIKSSESEKVAKGIYNSFPVWINLLIDYVNLFTKCATGPKPYIVEHSGSIVLYDDSKNKIEHESMIPCINITIGSNNPVNIEQFKKACDLASKNVRLPIAYSLLLSAYIARSERDYKKGFIEAATAIEICLRESILNKLKEQNVFEEDLLNYFQGLKKMFELAKMLKLPIEYNKSVEKFIKLRNKIIHKAELPPKSSELNKALSLAKNILDILSPI